MNKLTRLAVTLPLIGAFLLLPGITSAQTSSVASLQAEINSLLAEVQQLESQLAAAGGSTTANWCYSFNTNLSIGMTGSAVTALQTALQKDGESVTVNGTFDDQTAATVTGFQEKYASHILSPYDLTNGTGYAGKSTRAELNSLFGCHGVVPPPIVPPVTGTPTPTSNPTATSSLMVSQSGNIQSSVAAGATKVLIGSYSVTASQSEGVNLYGFNISVGGQYFQNVQLYINGSPFGAIWTQPSLSSAYSFSSAVPVVIQAGDSATVQIFANVSSLASGQVTAATVINTCLANGMVDNHSISCNGGAIGSGLTFTAADTAPWAEVQPTTLQFVATPGASNSQTAPQALTVYLSTPSAINVSASSAQNWLQVSAPVSFNNSASGAQVTVSVLPNALAAGSYTGAITIASPTNQFLPITVPVVLTVTSVVSTQTVTILSPATGTVWTAGTTQNIQWQTASPGQPMSLGISLFQNGHNLLNITNPSNVGSYAWTIPSGYTGSNFQIGILGPLGYVYSGMFSIAGSTTSTAPSSPTTSVLPVTVNSAFGNGTVVAGSSDVEVGSYIMTNPNSEAISISNLTIFIGTGTSVKNVRAVINNIQFGPTEPAPTDNGAYSVSGTPFIVPANGQTIVNVYADIVSPANYPYFEVDLPGCVGAGQTSGSSYNCMYAHGQSMTIVAPISTAPSNPMTVSVAGLGVQTNRLKTTADQLGTLAFAAPSTNPANLLSVTLTFASNVPLSTNFFNGINLLSSNSVSIGGTGGTVTGSCNNMTCTKTWGFNFGGWVVPAGSQGSFTIMDDDTQIPPQTSVAESLGVNLSGFAYSTNSSNTSSSVSLNPTEPINSISFPSGQ